MELIQAVTVGAGGASNITFTSIPQTYTDLVVKLSVRLSTSSGTNGIRCEISSNSSSVYTNIYLQGNGSTATSNSTGTVNYALDTTVNDTATTSSTFSSIDWYIPNYTSSSNKSILADSVTENNATTAYAQLWAGLQASSGAVTKLDFFPNAGGATFLQYSTAYLYGVSNISASAKATGGNIITTDGTYWYHTFTSSGTFTPTQALSANTLIVAGGGGGGYQGNGGGGGAGGLLYGTLSLSATSYAVTVGAGGSTPYPSAGGGGQGSNSTFVLGGTTYTAFGGGFGGGSGAVNGGNGGSGGGSAGSGSGGSATQTSQSPLTGYGNAGSSGIGTGGGGASEAGFTNVSSTVNGGLGLSYFGNYYSTGGNSQYPNSPATQNTGNGGNQGSTGGSGIVIIRYAV